MSIANGPQPSPAERPRTCGLAIASLVLSCMSFLLWPLGFLPGIICGHLARREIRRDPGLEGDGLALAGLIIGYVFAALFVFLFAASMLLWLARSRPHSVPPPVRVYVPNSAGSLFLPNLPQ